MSEELKTALQAIAETLGEISESIDPGEAHKVTLRMCQMSLEAIASGGGKDWKRLLDVIADALGNEE